MSRMRLARLMISEVAFLCPMPLSRTISNSSLLPPSPLSRPPPSLRVHTNAPSCCNLCHSHAADFLDQPYTDLRLRPPLYTSPELPTISPRHTGTMQWHLGFLNNSYTPTYRGFKDYLGYYSGAEDHFTHLKSGEVSPLLAPYPKPYSQTPLPAAVHRHHQPNHHPPYSPPNTLHAILVELWRPLGCHTNLV